MSRRKSEIWRPILGYRGVYEVSDLGRVRSNTRVVLRVDGRRRQYPGKLFVPSLISGYPVVSLRKNKKSRKRYVHELVLEAFVGPRPKGMCTRHYPDSDKENNKLSNLQWGTSAENVGDYLGKYLTDADVSEIHQLRDAGMAQKDIAEKFGCTQGYVSSLLNNRVRSVKQPSKNVSIRGSRWSREIIDEIRNARRGEPKKLAERFGVSLGYIYDIRYGRKGNNVR